MKLTVKLNHSWRRGMRSDDRRFWLLRAVAFYRLISVESVMAVEVYYKRLLVVCAVATLAVYLGAALGLHTWLARNPNNQVRRADLILPWHWRGLRAKLGDAAILEARAALAKADYLSAYLNLRVGVARAPANAEGRILLARLSLSREPVRALELAEEGLAYSRGDTTFLRGLFGLYQFHQASTRALATVDRLLAATGSAAVPPAVREFLLTVKAGVLSDAGRHAEALRVIAANPPGPQALPEDRRARRLVEISTLTRLGRAREARELFDTHRADLAPAGIAPLQAEADICLALADADRLPAVLRRLRAAEQESPRPYIFAFECWHRLKRYTLRDAAENEFFHFYGANDGALQLFGATLVRLGLDDHLARLRVRAAAAGVNSYAFLVQLTESALRRGDLEEATRLLRNWESATGKLAPAQRFHPEFIRRLTRAAFTGKEEQTEALMRHLEENRTQVWSETCRFAVEVLQRAGQLELGSRVLRLGRVRFPFSDPLAAAQADLDRRLAAAAPPPATAVPPTAASPTKAPAAAPATAMLAGTVGETLAALDALLERDSLVPARDLLRRLRQTNPTWLGANAAAVAVREIELAFATEGALASRNQVRHFLASFPSDSAALSLVNLARKFLARQRMADARVLHDEVKTARGDSDRVAAALRDLKLGDDLQDVLANRETTLRALDEWMSRGQWLETETLLGRLQKSAPAWATEARVELQVREVRLLLELGKKPPALQVFRELAGKPGPARVATFRLVRDYVVAGESARAVLLTEEAARLLPGEPAVDRLKREVQVALPPPEI